MEQVKIIKQGMYQGTIIGIDGNKHYAEITIAFGSIHQIVHSPDDNEYCVYTVDGMLLFDDGIGKPLLRDFTVFMRGVTGMLFEPVEYESEEDRINRENSQ